MFEVQVFRKKPWAKRIARNGQFLFFLQCFLLFWRTFCHFHQIWNCRLQTLSVWKTLKFVFWEGFDIEIHRQNLTKYLYGKSVERRSNRIFFSVRS